MNLIGQFLLVGLPGLDGIENLSQLKRQTYHLTKIVHRGKKKGKREIRDTGAGKKQPRSGAIVILNKGFTYFTISKKIGIIL